MTLEEIKNWKGGTVKVTLMMNVTWPEEAAGEREYTCSCLMSGQPFMLDGEWHITVFQPGITLDVPITAVSAWD